MTKKIVMFLTLLPVTLLSQERQLLRGKVITDELVIEKHGIENIAAGTSTITDSEGNFSLQAREGDQLRFTGEGFKPLVIKLSRKDMAEKLLVVRVEPDVTILREVVITGLTGNLAADSKKLETMQINSLFYASEINKDILPQTGIGGANWIAGITMLFRKVKPPKRAATYVQPAKSQRRFSEIVRETYPDKFFTDILKIPPGFIGPFLNYCDGRAERRLLQDQYEPELIEFLEASSMEFLKLNPDAK